MPKLIESATGAKRAASLAKGQQFRTSSFYVLPAQNKNLRTLKLCSEEELNKWRECRLMVENN